MSDFQRMIDAAIREQRDPNNDVMYHLNFEDSNLSDRLSNIESVLSQVSAKKSLILKNITSGSKSELARNHHSKNHQTSTNLSCRFKSSVPHVQFKCAKFDTLEKGWLFKKFDTNSEDKAIINNSTHLSLLSYDTHKLDFKFKTDLLKNLNQFFSTVALFGKSKPNLFCCTCFGDKSIRLEDIQKAKNVSVFKSKLNSQMTTSNTRVNLIDFGTCDSTVAIFDIRSGNACFTHQLKRVSEFNPILSVENYDHYLLCVARDSVNLLDMRNIGSKYMFEERIVSNASGINIAKIIRQQDQLKIGYTQVGNKAVHFFDIKTGMKQEKTLLTKRKVYTMITNHKDQELAILEGSEKMMVNFHDYETLTEKDSIGMTDDTIDVRFNCSGDSMITFGSKVCQVRCFEDDGMMEMNKLSVVFD